MAELGSHNTFSYLEPLKWYMKPFRFMARCQRDNIKEQVDKNIKYFDLRVVYDFKKDCWVFAHGYMKYKGDVSRLMLDLFDFLARKYGLDYKDEVKIALNLEIMRPSKKQEEKFIEFVKILQSIYGSKHFVGGFRKYDWSYIKETNLQNPSTEGFFSSCRGNKIDDLYPEKFSIKTRKEAFEAFKKSKAEYFLIDFV